MKHFTARLRSGSGIRNGKHFTTGRINATAYIPRSYQMETTNSTAGMKKNDYLKCPYCGWIFEWNAYFRCPSCYKEVNYDQAKEAFRKDTMK